MLAEGDRRILPLNKGGTGDRTVEIKPEEGSGELFSDREKKEAVALHSMR